MGGMNKAAFLNNLKAKRGFRTTTVDLPDFGEVTLRQLDQALRYQIQELAKASPEDNVPAAMASLAVSIIDPDTNEPMFTAEEALQVLGQLNPQALETLMLAFAELHSIPVPAIAKNSEASPILDSVSA